MEFIMVRDRLSDLSTPHHATLRRAQNILAKNFLIMCRSRAPDEKFLEIADPLTSFFSITFFFFTKYIMLSKAKL